MRWEEKSAASGGGGSYQLYKSDIKALVDQVGSRLVELVDQPTPNPTSTPSL